MSYATIQERLRKGQPILLDGPMNSELVRRGVRWRKHGLLTDAPAVLKLHEEYLAAGADVLRTNTFQLNPRTYLNVFRNKQHQAHIGAPGLAELTPKLLRTSVQLAKQARANAGNNRAARMAMMAMTTSSSMRVNPRRAGAPSIGRLAVRLRPGGDVAFI